MEKMFDGYFFVSDIFQSLEIYQWRDQLLYYGLVTKLGALVT